MRGVGRVVAFNWPRYAAALSTVAAGAVASAVAGRAAPAAPASGAAGPVRPAGSAGAAPGVALPATLRAAARVGTALAAGWTASSLVATWWAYDRSPLYGWRWLTRLLPAEPRRYAVVSAGLDEVSPALRRRYPAADPVLLDLYHPALTGTGSIRRARALVPPPAAARPARPEALPVPAGSLDAVFLVFAAHELRARASRVALFAEVARALRPGGRLLLVEHCRDVPNIAVYGPGAWHFYPRAEWLRLGRAAGLAPVAEATMTPLVRALVYQR